MKTFYILWSPQGRTPPRVTFDKRWEAELAAANMLKLHPHQDFHVMKAKSTHRPLLPWEKIAKFFFGQAGTTQNFRTVEFSMVLADLAAEYQSTVEYFGHWRPR